MKKLIILSAVALIASTSYAMASGEGEGKHDGKNRGGKMFDKKDTNGDGVVSEEEFLKAFKKRFKDMDVDGNGEITNEEAKESHKKMKEKREEHRKNKDQDDD